MDKLPSTTISKKSTSPKKEGKKATLRKLTDKEKADISKHIAKNNLDRSAASKLRFAQMKSAEGSTVRTTINKLAKNQAKETPKEKTK